MTIVKSQIRRGPIAQMPILDAGELGLASDQNRIFIGTEPRIGTYISSETIGGTPHAIVNFSNETEHLGLLRSSSLSNLSTIQDKITKHFRALLPILSMGAASFNSSYQFQWIRTKSLSRI